MQEKPTRLLDRWGRGLVLSLALHLIILVVFLMKLPALPELPQEEESVAVELVPPPEEEKPAEEPKQEEEKAAEPPPPPPPPPPAVEEKKAEEPPPSIPAFVPAVQFGEKDSGPREDQRGDSEENSVKPMETPPVEDTHEPEAAKADEASTETKAEDPTEMVDQPVEGEAPEEGETVFPTDQTLALAAPPPPKPAKPTEADGTAESEAPLIPKPVKRLYSGSTSEGLVAMSAMAGESRGKRAGRLCATELAAQLLRGSPPYVIHAYPLFYQETGNVIQSSRTAFGDVKGVWYDLAMRCMIDDDATRVVDFSFAVGAPVPRSEWKKRHFLDY